MIPPLGAPDHEAFCALLEAVNQADLAGLKALADCLKIVTVAQCNGQAAALLDHLTASLLSTNDVKVLLGMARDLSPLDADPSRN